MKAHSFFLFFALGILQIAGAGEIPLFTWDLLWAGSYYNSIISQDEDSNISEEILTGGTLYNRGNFGFGLPRLDTSLRFLVTDKRLMPPVDNDGKAGFNPGIGLYHHGSGSRFLYGVQSEYGLPARINNVWLRGIPFMESRSPSSRDLKIEPAAKDEGEVSLYLGLPQNILPGFDVFATAALDGEQNPAFGGGASFGRNGKEIRLEGFYTQKELSARKASTWFSSSPPLPERDFNIYALSFMFNSPFSGFATDWAFSETYAWGEGIYGNFALRLGNKPWRFSLAGDVAEGRFADRSGATAGEGFRLAAKGERFWPRSGLLRFQSSFRSPGFSPDASFIQSFNRGAVSVYLRPSAPTAAEKRADTFPTRFTRASLSMNRDARKPQKTADVLNIMAGYNFGPFTGSFSGSLHSLSFLGTEENSQGLFLGPVFETFDFFKVSGDLGWKQSLNKLGTLDLRTRLGYTVRAEKDNLVDLSLNASLRPAKWGRISLKVASTDFPEKWNYTLSWRFEGHGKF